MIQNAQPADPVSAMNVDIAHLIQSSVAPVFLLELALARPSYRDNILTFGFIWAAGSAAPSAGG